MHRFGPTGNVSEKTGPPFEVYHFSRSDRSEFWLNGSRPTKSSLCELACNPPREGLIFRAARLCMFRNFTHCPRYLSPVLDAQRRERPELDHTIPQKKEKLLFLVYKHSLKESYYKKHFLVISFVETMLLKVVLILQNVLRHK